MTEDATADTEVTSASTQKPTQKPTEVTGSVTQPTDREDPYKNVELYSAGYSLGSIRAATGEAFQSTNRFVTDDYIPVKDIEGVSVSTGYQLS